jgi:hypothetical protein
MSNIKKNFPHLSNKEFIILEMLVYRSELFGLEMSEASDGKLKKAQFT